MLQSKKLINRSALFLASLLVLFELTACNQSSSTEELEKYDAEMQSQKGTVSEDARTLTEIAGKATAPVVEKMQTKSTVRDDKFCAVCSFFIFSSFYFDMPSRKNLLPCDSG